ncbi:MAG: hypothetical protein ACTSWD_09535 [Candidatus Heimdallarchaeota archaeon]
MSKRAILENYLKNKKVLIVGGSPSASNKSKEWYDSFDVIVRCNNYKKINSDRTDIYFSYFGRNIKKTKTELIDDGVRYLINKCPNADMSESLAKYDIDMKDYRWIYDLREYWWFVPVIEFTEADLIEQIKMLDGYMPTSGLSAILFISKFISQLDIIGFDCFESGVSNLNETWNGTGNHNSAKEKQILTELEQIKGIIWNK